MAICVHCECEFDLYDKRKRAKIENRPMGRINECLDCVDHDVVKLTGVMVYSHKTAGEIQINKDPKLTAFLKRGWHNQINARDFDRDKSPEKHYNRLRTQIEVKNRRR